MTNRNSAPISHQQITKKSIQVAGHYSAHIGIAPSSKLTGLQISLQSGSIIITDILLRPVLLPHILSDFLAPYLCFNVMFQHFFTFTLKRAGISLRTYLVAPHILTSCMQKYSVVKVRGAYAAISEWKGTMLTACYATSKANIFVISFVSNLRRRVSSMQ